MAVQIVVDSTADIPLDRARELGIEVVPLTVMFGDQSFRRWRGSRRGELLSETEQQSYHADDLHAAALALFEETFRRLIAKAPPASSRIHIAGNSAAPTRRRSRAAEAVSADTGVPIEVSIQTLSPGGFGLPAEIVAREARAGADLQTLKAHGESLCIACASIAVLDTLEFLQRGGRIGRARAMLGTALKVKPLLEVRDGQVCRWKGAYALEGA